MTLLNLETKVAGKVEPKKKAKKGEKEKTKGQSAQRETRNRVVSKAGTSAVKEKRAEPKPRELPDEQRIFFWDRARFVRELVKFRPANPLYVTEGSTGADLKHLDHYCVEFSKKFENNYLGSRFKVYNYGAEPPQSYWELEEGFSTEIGSYAKGWHQRSIKNFPFAWPIQEADVEMCPQINNQLRTEVEGSSSYSWIMKNTLAVILTGEVPEVDESREFRIVINDGNETKKCDDYFIKKYCLGPATTRYWERVVVQRGGGPARGELKPVHPFETQSLELKDAYNPKDQTIKVTWKT